MATDSLSTWRCTNPWSWMGAEAAWIYMNDIKGGRLLRWQILKAAAKERGYCGSTSARKIAEDSEAARAEWLKWFSAKATNAAWFYLKLDALLENAKFQQFRRTLKNIGRTAPLLPI